MEDIIFCGLNLGAWVTIVTVLSMFATLLLIFGRYRHSATDWRAGHEGGSERLLIGLCGSHRCAFCCVGWTGTYGRVAMDCPLLAGNTEELFGSSGQTDVACCSTQLYIAQHNGGGTLCRHREGMGKETAHGTF